MTNILEDYEPEADFAKAHRLHPRTVARYRTEPDGIPWLEFGGRIYIHIPGAKEWLARRVRRNKPRRAA